MQHYVTHSYHRTELQAELALIEDMESGLIAECEKPRIVQAGNWWCVRVLDLAAVLEGAE